LERVALFYLGREAGGKRPDVLQRVCDQVLSYGRLRTFPAGLRCRSRCASELLNLGTDDADLGKGKMKVLLAGLLLVTVTQAQIFSPKYKEQRASLDSIPAPILAPSVFAPPPAAKTNVTFYWNNIGASNYTLQAIQPMPQYMVRGLVRATNEAENSFYLDMDKEPTDPECIWDIEPLTHRTNFEWRTVSWRGNGTAASNQFNPKIWTLWDSNNPHQMIVRGREANAQVKAWQIVTVDNAFNGAQWVDVTNTIGTNLSRFIVPGVSRFFRLRASGPLTNAPALRLNIR
jgi:hypothetical protein